MKTYYTTLEVPQNADDDAIKKAYRTLAKKFHPDVNQGNKEAEQRFKEIGEAYEALSDAAKRREYDRKLAEQAGTAKKTTQRRTADPEVNFDPGKINFGQGFEDFFGFNPKSTTVDKNKMGGGATKKNPLDASDVFDRFMGFRPRGGKK